ncbi:MAG: ABC transporter ATP-binding protein [Myxococcales bacterium]|nr:ABC transporter ATP-binding protein [Myxococcales bacterium]
MLCLAGLVKKFGATVAVDGLSLEVGRGEVLGFLGPNGAGKTTTLGMIVGAIRPDAGRVEIDGAAPSIAAVRASVGIAPQSLALYDDLTARENLWFFARLYGLSRAHARARADALLAQVELTPRADDRVGGFSGGMKRRLNLAAALVHDPQLVLLDEPTAGVDPQSRNGILELVRGLASAGKTLLYSTHYMEEAQRLCSRVAIVDHGKLLLVDRVDALLARHGGRSVVHAMRGDDETRVETEDPVREVARQLDAGGVTSLRIDRPDLESVFLNLTGRSLRD